MNPLGMGRGATQRGYRIDNLVRPVQVTRHGEGAPFAYCETVVEALALVEADKRAAAGPLLRCPGCMGNCECLPG